MNQIQELENEVNLLEVKLIDLKAKLSRLKNPDFPQYTDEELTALFYNAEKSDRKNNKLVS